MLKKIILLSMLFLIPIQVLALDIWNNQCLDNITLRSYTNYTACNSTSCDYGNNSFYKDCEFGCDSSTQSCNSSPINQYLFVGVALLIIIFVLIVIIKVARR
jgi:hypothetical protein